MLSNSKVFEVPILKNQVGKIKKRKIHFCSISNDTGGSINCFVKSNFDSDKRIRFCSRNYFGVSPYHSRFDGFSGARKKG
jgi:hypothetical protein